MSEISKIEWTDGTFNTHWGCTEVSPGCDGCYARGLAGRFGVQWGPGAPRKTFSDKHWDEPLKWDRKAAAAGKRIKVFSNSMSDLMDNEAPPGVRERWFSLTKATPNIDWLMLTKRIGNAARMLPADWGDGYPNVWVGATVVNQEEADRDIQKLLAIPAAKRFLSLEPILSAIDISRWLDPTGIHCIDVCPDSSYVDVDKIQTFTNGAGETEPVCEHCGLTAMWTGYDSGIDWVIAGGESGPKARPPHPDWIRGVRDHCTDAAIPFTFKQWGDWKPISHMLSGEHDSYYRSIRIAKPDQNQSALDDLYGRKCMVPNIALNYAGGTGLDIGYQSIDGKPGMLMFKIGKKAAGRILDGRTWDEVPS